MSSEFTPASSSSEESTNEQKLLFSNRVHEYNSEQIALFDAKAGLAVIVCGAFLKLLYDVFWEKLCEANGVALCINLVSFIPFVCFFLSCIYLYNTIFPRVQADYKNSLVFWMHVKKHHKMPEDYGAKILGLKDKDCVTEMACNNHELSAICIAKFEALKKAMFFCIIGVIITFTLILLKPLLLCLLKNCSFF
jgi:hypothetical protein